MKFSTSLVEADRAQWALTCLAFAQHDYHQHGLLFRLLHSKLRSTGIAISSAIQGGVVSKYLIENLTTRCFQFVPESMSTSLGTRWTDIYPYAGFDEIPISLSNRDTEVSTVRHPFMGTNWQGMRRFRRLDSFYGGSKRPIDFLHIGEPISRVIDILIGGKALLARDQPLLIIETQESNNIFDLVGTLKNFNYMLFDSSLQVISDCQNHSVNFTAETETCFLALSKSFVEQNGLIKSFWPKDIHLANRRDWQQALVIGLTREARRGGIRFVPPSPARRRYSIGKGLRCEGFYPTEYQGEQEWRWLGPRPSASIFLPTPSVGVYKLALYVLAEKTDNMIDGTRLFLDGKLLKSTRETVDGTTKLIADIEICLEQVAPEVELSIAVPLTCRASSDDPRMIGICVFALDISPLHS